MSNLPDYIVAMNTEFEIEGLNPISVRGGSEKELVPWLIQILTAATSFQSCGLTCSTMEELEEFIINEFNKYNNSVNMNITIVDNIRHKVVNNCHKESDKDSTWFSLDVANYKLIGSTIPIKTKNEIMMYESAIDTEQFLLLSLLNNENLSDADCRKKCIETLTDLKRKD